ncbi:MAG: RHS repeat domain-containing protein [Planctomycetales bacterium]
MPTAPPTPSGSICDGTAPLRHMKRGTLNSLKTQDTRLKWAAPAYNAVGNMTTVPQPLALGSSFTATYDAWNRLVKLVDGANLVHQSAYDGLHRRTVKTRYTAGVLDEIRHQYYSAAWQNIEERMGTTPDTATANRRFVWGLRYIDDLVLRDRDVNGDGTMDERYYALQDPNWNVIALADINGDIQERFAYDAYGKDSVLTPTFAARASSTYGWEHRYAGYRRDGESGLYQVRHRFYHPTLGVWIGRDPISYGSGMNLSQYVASIPVAFSDPFGLGEWDLNLAGDAGKAAPATLRQIEPRSYFTKRVFKHEYAPAFEHGLRPGNLGSGGASSMALGAGSRWIPMSTNQLGAQGFRAKGPLLHIDRGVLDQYSVEYLTPDELANTIRRDLQLSAPRKSAWRNVQQRDLWRTLQDPFGPVNPITGTSPPTASSCNLKQCILGGEQEAAAKDFIPPQALRSSKQVLARRALRGGGKALLGYGIYDTYSSLKSAAKISEESGSMEPFYEEVAGQAGGWGGGFLGGMAGGAAVGALGGPVGAVVGGLIGGIGGAMAGSEFCKGAYGAFRDGPKTSPPPSFSIPVMPYTNPY